MRKRLPGFVDLHRLFLLLDHKHLGSWTRPGVRSGSLATQKQALVGSDYTVPVQEVT